MGNEAASGIKGLFSERLNAKNLGRGLLYGYLMMMIILAVFAYVISLTKFPEKFMSGATIIATIISIIITGIIASKGAKSKGWLTGLIGGLLYYVVLYILSLLILDVFEFNLSALTNLLTCLIAGAFGGVLRINFGRPQKVKYKRM